MDDRVIIGTSWCLRNIKYCPVQYNTVLLYTEQYYTVLHSAAFYCTVPFCSVQKCHTLVTSVATATCEFVFRGWMVRLRVDGFFFPLSHSRALSHTNTPQSSELRLMLMMNQLKPHESRTSCSQSDYVRVKSWVTNDMIDHTACWSPMALVQLMNMCVCLVVCVCVRVRTLQLQNVLSSSCGGEERADFGVQRRQCGASWADQGLIMNIVPSSRAQVNAEHHV